MYAASSDWIIELVCKFVVCLYNWKYRIMSDGPLAYPIRNPGANILEKLSSRITRFSLSRDWREGNGARFSNWINW